MVTVDLKRVLRIYVDDREDLSIDTSRNAGVVDPSGEMAMPMFGGVVRKASFTSARMMASTRRVRRLCRSVLA
jgi:hypothetical protein